MCTPHMWEVAGNSFATGFTTLGHDQLTLPPRDLQVHQLVYNQVPMAAPHICICLCIGSGLHGIWQCSSPGSLVTNLDLRTHMVTA